jgi:hypothetical protein
MSITLTWASSGLGTKTATTIAGLFNDLDTLITANSGNAAFFWQVASKNVSATNPQHLVLKRKDASAGRILLVHWTSAPAANNAAILESAPVLGSVYIAYFPSGNVDTPSNLLAASGTIMGDDTNALKVTGALAVATAYAASIQPYYFDSAEAVLICTQNPAAATIAAWGAGDLLIATTDAAVPATFSSAAFQTASTFSPYTSTKPVAGSSVAVHIRCNSPVANTVFYQAWTPSGPWNSTAIGSTDVLTDTSVTKVWHVPMQVMSNIKGGGFPFKLRQLGYGPVTTGALAVYNTSGGVAARSVNAATTGLSGGVWLTNFKL